MPTKNTSGKTAAIIAYLTIFGTIIAFFMNFDYKNKYTYFHIRQAMGIQITFYLILFFVSNFQNEMAAWSFYIFFMALWFYGFISALNNSTKPVPLLGEFYQRLFKMVGEE
jgi:uncharacterized membrane protein